MTWGSQIVVDIELTEKIIGYLESATEIMEEFPLDSRSSPGQEVDKRLRAAHDGLQAVLFIIIEKLRELQKEYDRGTRNEMTEDAQ